MFVKIQENMFRCCYEFDLVVSLQARDETVKKGIYGLIDETV